MLNRHGARAWLAIEDPAKPWPALAAGKPGAGPFYLVWTDPAAGHISPEQWPFQVARIQRLAPVAERFPALLPAPGLAANDPVNQGFALFQKNCLACHRLNGAGDAQFGPDLNIPYNPTEYFNPGFLKRYIRDPQGLRRWPQAKMPGFSASVLPDAELELLLGYLKHMAGRKQIPELRALAQQSRPPSKQPATARPLSIERIARVDFSVRPHAQIIAPIEQVLHPA